MYINRELLLEDLRKLNFEQLEEKGLIAVGKLAVYNPSASATAEELYSVAEAIAVLAAMSELSKED